MRSLSGEELDAALASGDRQWVECYRTQCPTCSACEALRVPVHAVRPSKSQRRVWKNQDIKVTVGPAVFLKSDWRYNRHKNGASKDRKLMTRQGYEG